MANIVILKAGRRALVASKSIYNRLLQDNYVASSSYLKLIAHYTKLNSSSVTGSMGSNYKSDWEDSPSGFDFRSDTFTTPTKIQLNALHSASLGDDVYHESHSTNAFEKRMAGFFGKPAGIFVMSGTMGNQLCLRALLTQPPYSVLCDHRAHIIVHEAGGLAMLSQAMTQPVVPSNGKYLTLEDIQKAAVLSDDVHNAPTRVISLENTLGGNIMPLEEVQRIGDWAREKGVKMHLDGARIWNAVAIYDTVEEQLEKMKVYAKEFDTLTACFSKGIGAPVGSIIVSSENIIGRVRHFRKAIGGGIRQAGILTSMAEAAVEEVFLAGKLRKTHQQAKRIAEYWVNELDGKLEHEVETNMVWLNLSHSGIGDKEFEEEAQKAGVKVFGWGRIVVHWQISEDGVLRLMEVLADLKRKADARGASGEQHGNGTKSGYGQ